MTSICIYVSISNKQFTITINGGPLGGLLSCARLGEQGKGSEAMGLPIAKARQQPCCYTYKKHYFSLEKNPKPKP